MNTEYTTEYIKKWFLNDEYINFIAQKSCLSFNFLEDYLIKDIQENLNSGRFTCFSIYLKEHLFSILNHNVGGVNFEIKENKNSDLFTLLIKKEANKGRINKINKLVSFVNNYKCQKNNTDNLIKMISIIKIVEC